MLNSISELLTILKKPFLYLSAAIPTFNNKIFLKILWNFIFTRYFKAASARDGRTVTNGQKSNVKNQIPQSFPISLLVIFFIRIFST